MVLTNVSLNLNQQTVNISYFIPSMILNILSFYHEGATIPSFVSLRPILDFPFNIILESQHIASKHPPAGACPNIVM